jgi:hypothetical protein
MNFVLFTHTVAATAAITADRFITHAGAVPAAGAVCLGVARTSAESGDVLSVDVIGTTMVTAGDTITVGAAVETDNAGRAIPLDSGVKLGRALTAGATGALVEVLLIPA